ncbi:uncharacterized protein LOC143300671 [Babylonia areolata]|uniref:uncharacterized protein LOC143300671 n=1 Tax=Babylonia areolata TaxID=304850 RepID=UPI003FD68DA1
MSAFSSRTGGYKIGVILLFLATALFLAGMGAPYWLTTVYQDYSYDIIFQQGLWMHCVKTEISYAGVSTCEISGVVGFPGWFHAVRSMEILCNLGAVISCIYALLTNCCRSLPGPRSRFLEILAGLAGTLGFTGCMIYLAMIKMGHSESDLQTIAFSFISGTKESDFNWAFYLAALGSGVIVIDAIVIGISNKSVDSETTGGMVMTTMGATAQPGSYPPPQQQYYGNQPGVVAQP